MVWFVVYDAGDFMQKPQIIDAPFVNSVLHPTDLSPASQNAFAHALAISLLRKTRIMREIAL